jgi:hypothetical protein
VVVFFVASFHHAKAKKEREREREREGVADDTFPALPAPVAPPLGRFVNAGFCVEEQRHDVRVE